MQRSDPALNMEKMMKILRTPEVIELTGLSRATIWRLERKGKFPARLHLGENAIGWLDDEVMDWMASRPRGMIRRKQFPTPNRA
jgi:prophage regulatory protein